MQRRNVTPNQKAAGQCALNAGESGTDPGHRKYHLTVHVAAQQRRRYALPADRREAVNAAVGRYPGLNLYHP